jgi:mono/diheme cytochrome c family protein
VALSGVHELCQINLSALHARLRQASTDKQAFENVPNNFRFLHGIKKRIPLHGKSPRHIAISGEKVFVSAYFSPFLDVVETSEGDPASSSVVLGKEPLMGPERRGALNFADANLCFQQWQSCVSCHPDGRSDALNWDLLNDGVGNPKNTKSMLYAHQTPPAMITGIRDNAAVAVRAGIRHILFAVRPETDAADIDTYLDALDPVPSPYLVEDRLSADARKGRSIFKKAGCGSCHSGPYFTDGKKHSVGTGTDRHAGTSFDTPSLIEVWRTAPYLYDGRAKTIKEVLTVHNRSQEHGATAELSQKEINQLEAYVLCL